MTRSELVHKVRQRIDEVGVNETVSLNFPVDAFLLEAINQTLLNAPLRMAGNIVDFSSTQIVNNSDGSGTIKLPENFMRLVEFKMQGWQRSVYETYAPNDNIVMKQQFSTTRAGTARPIVIAYTDTLTYFSIPNGKDHIVEIARAQVAAKSTSDLPDVLSDAAAWLTAGKVLQVMNERALSEGAIQQYIQIIATLKSQ